MRTLNIFWSWEYHAMSKWIRYNVYQCAFTIVKIQVQLIHMLASMSLYILYHTYFNSPSVPLFSFSFPLLFLLCLGFVFQPTASLSARMEECASGLSSVSVSLARKGRHVNRRRCPHNLFQRRMGMNLPMGTTLVTQMDTPTVTLMDTV